LDDPYKPPTAALDAPPLPLDEATRIRRLHLQREAEIRGLGFLYLVGSFSLVTPSLLLFMVPPRSDAREMRILIWVMLALGGLLFVGSWGLRRLRQWAWGPAILGSCALLLLAPFGTPLGLCGLYLILQEKGRRVLAPDYARVVADTPALKPGHSRLLLGTTAVIGVGGFVALVMGR
jgi:hypothetical protein